MFLSSGVVPSSLIPNVFVSTNIFISANIFIPTDVFISTNFLKLKSRCAQQSPGFAHIATKR
jgi:hypothetical protein